MFKNGFHFYGRKITVFLALLFLLSPASIAIAKDGKYMISAANPLAAEAGRKILEKGGSAVDAAIATQLVLTLVEPQSSGIGGGAFLVHFNNVNKKIQTYDGREMAPAAVKEDHFLKNDGKPLKFYEAVVGGRAVGAPGALAMLKKAHDTHGKLPWNTLFEDAITLAQTGFKISPRLHFLLNRDKYLKTKEPARSYFYTSEGNAKAEGTVLKNPELAKTLTRIRDEGINAFYKGEIARKIVQAVQNDPTNPGVLTEEDLANYIAKERSPVCLPYHNETICGMGPPTSGGVTALQILKLLEKAKLAETKPGSLEAIHLISQASALAFADRGMYLADKDFVDVPVKGLLDAGYLLDRSKQITKGNVTLPFEAGTPPKTSGSLSPDDAIELPSTSHFSIVDKDGNAVSMTTSVENVFGSRLMAGGFILNNQLTDFSFRPQTEKGPVANRIQPGKRPRSSMNPMIILGPDNNLRAVIGSPGGSRIIGYVTKTVIGILDWNLSIQEAINLPHHINRNGTLDLEKETAITAQKEKLEALGYKVKVRTLNSGLHGILIRNGTMEGGADPRREGIVLSN